MKNLTILIFFLLMGGLTAQAFGQCDDFEDGTLGNWIGQFATINNQTAQGGNNFLHGGDEDDSSWFYNEIDYRDNYSCTQFCLDYRVFDDGEEELLDVFPRFKLYVGIFNSQALAADFVATTPITVNSGWVTYCFDFYESAPPTGWTMVLGDDDEWADLLNNVTGFAITTDLPTSGDGQTTDEEIGVDNICRSPVGCVNFDDGPQPFTNNANATMTNTMAAPTADGTPYLEGSDANGSSFVYYEPLCTTDFSCVDVCFDYKVIADGFAQNDRTLNINPHLYIYSGTVDDPASLRARYYDFSVVITENSPWINVCVPISNIAMPDGWEMLNNNTPNDWPTLVNNITGIAFTTDVALAPNNNTNQEVIGVDNVCINPVVEEFELDASVTLGEVFYGDDYVTLAPVNYNTYAGLGVTHEWYLYSAPDENGPYTFEAYYDTDYFEYELGEYEVYYFLVHKITSRCQQVCDDHAATYNTGGSGLREEVGRNEFDGCSLIDETRHCTELSTPTDLDEIGNFLTWSAVPGVAFYQVIATTGGHNGCECNDGGSGTSIILGTTQNPYFELTPNQAARCFSWQVRAWCSEEVASDVSAPMCHYATQVIGDEEFGGNTPGQGSTHQHLAQSVQLFPNPVHDRLNFRLNGDVLTGSEVRVRVVSATGQVVQAVDYPADTFSGTLDVSQLPAGMYQVQFIQNNGELINRKVIVQ